MKITNEQLTPTKRKLTIAAESSELAAIKEHVLRRLSANVKVQGFRPGKAPLNIVEKNVDQNVLQTEFLDHAVNDLYVQTIEQQQVRPAAQPSITVTKFVPFTTLEFVAEVEAVGAIKLADYKKIKLPLPKVTVTAKDVDEVLENLRGRAAEKKAVERAARQGDEAVINFSGTDAKTKEAIPGADGTDYPLVLGSNAFIPGFEEEVVGLKPGAEKTFDITFPKDYGAQDMQGRKVTFKVTVTKVNERVLPKLDDAFAATVGPFKTLADLKADIKKQLSAERQREAQRAYDNDLLQKITETSDVPVPDALVEEEIDRIEEEEKRNVVYQGQTWQEHLDAEGLSAEAHREKQREAATLRVKAGLVLGEIAQEEGVTVTPEELETRVMLLKNQYPEEAMQAELDKPENRRDILNRMMTEKTLETLRAIAG